MPAMPRPNKKATQIAFNILGVPANMRSKKTESQKKLDQQLLAQQTSRIK